MGLADLIRSELERMAVRRQPAVSSWPEREAALEAVRVFDVERGYRAPSEWDHVHRVERDAPPVRMDYTPLDEGAEPVSANLDAVAPSRNRDAPASSPTEGCLGG